MTNSGRLEVSLVTVGVVYFSGTETTAALAEQVIAGISDAGAEMQSIRILGDQIKDGRWEGESLALQLDDCDAIIFGSPTYMGSTSSQMKSFMDAMAPRWFSQAWRNKIASTPDQLTEIDQATGRHLGKRVAEMTIRLKV